MAQTGTSDAGRSFVPVTHTVALLMTLLLPVAAAVSGRRAPAPISLPAAGDEGEPANAAPGLLLRAAEVVRADLDDDEEELASFAFEESVHGILDRQGFLVTGPDSRVQTFSTDAAPVKGSCCTVLVSFPPGTDLLSYTIAAVRSGVIANRNGEVNIQNSSPLGGRRRRPQGPTAAPDLLWVEVDRTLNRARYLFDDALDEHARGDPALFGYYTPSGRLRVGSRLISVEDNVVAVEFGRGAQVQEAVRFVALEGAVRSRRGYRSLPRAVGSGTTRPDLTAVRQIADTIFDFLFDEAVAHAVPSEFAVYTAAGAKYVGQAVARPDASSVRAVFPAVDGFGDQVVLAVAGIAAVRTDDGSADRGTLGTVTLRPGTILPGRSSGPDLMDVEVDPETGLVDFFFDERLAQALVPGDLKPGRFALVTSDGALLPGRLVADIEGRRVTVLFGRGDLREARAFTVDVGAVIDGEGHPNPPAAVRGAAVRRAGIGR